MRTCDQSLVTLKFLWEKLSWPHFHKDLTKETAFFEGWSWFKLTNLGLALGTNTSVARGLKLKVRKFWRLIPTFLEVTEEKLVPGCLFGHPILIRVKFTILIHEFSITFLIIPCSCRVSSSMFLLSFFCWEIPLFCDMSLLSS